MLTPDERYQLDRLRESLHEQESTLLRVLKLTRHQIRHLDRMLDLGPNPHIPLAPPYVTRAAALAAQQMKAAATGPVCTCDFGWQPDCPRHRDPDAAYTDDHQDERPPARPDGSIRHWPVCPQNHPAGEWCPTTPPDIIEAHDRFLRGEVITGTIGQPRIGVQVERQFPAKTPEQEAADDIAAQHLDATIRHAKGEPPTPRDLFGR